jgi:serine/threonine protein kinase
MGDVYRAIDTRVGRTVAIKVLPPDAAAQSDRRLRFEREARAVARLNHPHICTLYDVGQQDGLEFLVMEYLDGETLGARLARGPLPLAEALKHAAALAQALARAHREGITHRDIKPSNIMLTESGVKLLDFGLAKLRERESGVERSPLDEQSTGTALSPEGTVIGTIAYMSPEQLEGRQVDSRTDIYALGLIIYEMVTGQRAFAKGSQAGLIAAILTEAPPRCPTRSRKRRRRSSASCSPRSPRIRASGGRTPATSRARSPGWPPTRTPPPSRARRAGLADVCPPGHGPPPLPLPSSRRSARPASCGTAIQSAIQSALRNPESAISWFCPAGPAATRRRAPIATG